MFSDSKDRITILITLQAEHRYVCNACIGSVHLYLIYMNDTYLILDLVLAIYLFQHPKLKYTTCDG